MPASSPSNLSSLKGAEIVIGVCGGIAAYKVADLVSKLVQAGAGVTVCMTENAQQFVTPVTFQALSGRPVSTEMYYRVGTSSPDHLGLTEKADLMLIAPATGNILGKVANGISDDLISAMICAAACPVVFAPAMNHRMWLNPITQENVEKLKRHGYRFIGPAEGRMAEGTSGPGRLVEPAQLLTELAQILDSRTV